MPKRRATAGGREKPARVVRVSVNAAAQRDGRAAGPSPIMIRAGSPPSTDRAISTRAKAMDLVDEQHRADGGGEQRGGSPGR